MYEGLLNSEYENIIFRTISEAPVEYIFENFRGIESEKNNNIKEKPTIGLWGSFSIEDSMPINIDKNENYPWEHFSKYNFVKQYNNGMFGLDYKLPKNCNILVFDVEKDLDYLLKKYGDWKTIGSNFDAIIQTSSEYPYDVPSVCITNKETFKNLQVENYFYRDNFESERIFITKDLINNALDNLDNCGYLLKYLDDNLKNDIDICERAINQNAYSINFIGNKIKDNKDFIINIVNKKGENLSYASDKLKDNKEIVIEACNNNGNALKYASDRLKNDRDVVLEAYKNDIHSLQFASDEIKNNKDIIFEFYTYNKLILDNIHPQLKSDKDFIFNIYKNYDSKLYFIDDDLKNSQFIKDLINSKRSGTLDSFKENYSYYFKFSLENLKDDSVSFNNCLKALEEKDLKDSKVIDALCERFSQYECSKDFDLDMLKKYPNNLLEIIKNYNFDNEELFLSKDISIENVDKKEILYELE